MAPIVVLAVDHSESSIYAFNYYVENFYKQGIEVHVLHVPEYVGHVKVMEGPSPAVMHELREKVEKDTKQLEQRYKEMLQQKGVSGQVVVEHGKDAWHVIVDYAKRKDAMLVAMGTRGMNTLRRTLMGSVSDGVVHHSPVPVLVCRHKE